MNKNNVSLRGLRIFCVAAKHESFRDAAERLFVTASAVSHQIKNLEEELGQQLFERGARHLKLSEVGLALYEEVNPLIEEIEETVSAYRMQAGKSILNISVQPFFASELFVPRLPDFTAAHPEIEIKINTSDESLERHAGSSDVSIRVFRTPPTGLIAEKLFPLSLIPAGSPVFKKTVKLQKHRIVSDFPRIVHEGRSKAWQLWEKTSGIKLPKNGSQLRLGSMIAVARAAERGLGAALVPVELSTSWFEGGNLVPLFDTHLVTEDAYYFVCDPEIANEPAVRLMRDWAIRTFAATRVAA